MAEEEGLPASKAEERLVETAASGLLSRAAVGLSELEASGSNGLEVSGPVRSVAEGDAIREEEHEETQQRSNCPESKRSGRPFSGFAKRAHARWRISLVLPRTTANRKRQRALETDLESGHPDSSKDPSELRRAPRTRPDATALILIAVFVGSSGCRRFRDARRAGRGWGRPVLDDAGALHDRLVHGLSLFQAFPLLDLGQEGRVHGCEPGSAAARKKERERAVLW